VSNIAGKAYALNVLSPTRFNGFVNRVIFWAIQTRWFGGKLDGLMTLSLIHYARWAIVAPKDFPNLGEGQPKEDLEYNYEFFFSNFNGSWDQYIDSFSMSIASGLDSFWFKNINYPKSIPIEAFHRYINANQVATDCYYNAYPLAASNDVKSAQQVRAGLLDLVSTTASGSDEAFMTAYDNTVLGLQTDLSFMAPSPVVSLAHEAVDERIRIEGLGS
jgi:hypothetical protein